jgi:hypothetical protein
VRILTPLARPGLVLLRSVTAPGGKLLFGRGTALTRRYLRVLHEEGLRVLEVENDTSVEPWERVPEVDEFVRGLEARFHSVRDDRRMTVLKNAVQGVYLDFLFELEE